MTVLSAAEITELQDLLAETFVYFCDIKRSTTSEDGYNLPVPGTPAAHITNEPCGYGPLGGAGQQNDGTRAVVFDQYQVIVPVDTDVTEADQVSEVRDGDGTAVGGPYRILHVVRDLTHLQLVLQESR